MLAEKRNLLSTNINIILRQTRRGLAVDVAIQLYKGLIRPHLEYSAAVWMYKTSVLKEFHSVQHTCLKQTLWGVQKFIGCSTGGNSRCVSN